MNIKILPPEVQQGLLSLPQRRRDMVTELRLRIGRPATMLIQNREEVLPGNILVTDKLLENLLNRATGYSPYALKLEESGLFLPLEGGGRLGLCGDAVIHDGKLMGMRQLSSVSVRIPHQILGVAKETAERLLSSGQVPSVLIVSPPGEGKTTFLRDLIRLISQRGFRVAVADERRELSGMTGGVPQLELGPATDVLAGCPKETGIPLLIRAMNPQVLAVDEISGDRELELVTYAAFCGIAVLATAHGTDLGSLQKRSLYRRLLDSGAFSWCITLKRGAVPKMERVEAE